MPSCLRENTAKTRGGVRGRLPTKDGRGRQSRRTLRRQLPPGSPKNIRVFWGGLNKGASETHAPWRRCTSSGRTAATFPPKGKALCKPPCHARGKVLSAKKRRADTGTPFWYIFLCLKSRFEVVELLCELLRELVAELFVKLADGSRILEPERGIDA